MMLGRFLVARLHVGAGEIRMDQLIVRFHFFGLVPFGDGGGVIAFGVISAAQGQLRVEILRIVRQDGAKPLNGAVHVPRAELEHGVIKLFLQTWHIPHHTIDWNQCRKL